MKINFKPIRKAPQYGISECGQVFNFETKRHLKPVINGHGYLLFSAGAKYKLSVHRQVAELYVPNPNNYPVVNHIDGNKLNNHYTNLEWTTHSGNTRHAFAIGLCKPVGLGKFGKDNVRSKPIVQYSLTGEVVREWDCAMQAEREGGFTNGTISEVCRGKHKSHKGFIFKYK